MTTVLTDLQALGYEVHAQGDRLHLQWRGEGKPPGHACCAWLRN
jgi:hypothetical protein